MESARRSQNTVRIRVALVAALFGALTLDGLGTFFTGDDLMNLYKVFVNAPGYALSGMLRFWSSDYYRPLGALAYIGLYDAFGFHPLPFRIAGFVILFFNLWLAFRVLERLVPSRERAALVLLLVAYNARMNDLYLNFGTVYEMLCFSFYYLALLWWLRIRSAGRSPRAVEQAGVLLLYVLALDAKEMAVSLPVVLLLWELLLAPRREAFRRHAFRAALRMLPLVLLTVGFLAGKLHGPESLANLDAYHPSLSLDSYLAATTHYLNNAFLVDWCTHARAAGALVAAAALCLALRAPRAGFGLGFFVASLLPVSFILPRSGFVLYIGMPGLGLWLVESLQALLERWRRRPAFASLEGWPAFLAACVGIALVGVQFKAVFDPAVKGYIDRNERFYAAFVRTGLVPRPGAYVLLVDDPYDDDVYDPLFLLALARHDPSLEVHRAKMPDRVLEPLERYDLVFDAREDVWKVLKAEGRPASAELAGIAARLGMRLPPG